MNDLSRDRNFPLDLYLPQQQTTKPFPLIVISHGKNKYLEKVKAY